MEHKGFEIPRHTQVPNSFLDDTLPQIKSIGELKVLLAIMRQTFGWRKFTDRISMSQLVKLTGLTRQGVNNGLKLSLAHGYIERTPAGQSFSYGLKLVKQVDQSIKLTSQEDKPELVKEVDRQLVKQIDPQKKGIKEKKERERNTPPNGNDPRLLNPFVVAYRDACHLTPNHEQRAAIISQVEDADIWNSVLARFMREGQRPQRVDWLLERYAKACVPMQGRPLTSADIQRMKEAV